ncbi:MAG: hypothetical protein ABSB94_02860 [Syntrophorhabdales bacterium]|jgi:hypothetical protein
MEKENVEEKIIEIMMTEYGALREEIRLIMNAIIRDFQIFLGFLAAIFAFSIKGDSGSNDPFNVQVVITFVPYLFFAFSFFFLIKMANLMTNAAYVRDIENRINTLLGSNVLNWESSITQKLLFDFRTPFVISATLFFYVTVGWVWSCLHFGIFPLHPRNSAAEGL